MYDLQFRVHQPWSDVSGLLVPFFNKSEKGFLFQHEADEEVARQHVHGYLFGYPFKRSSLSESIAKKLNITGNVDFFTSDKCSRKDPRPLDISGAYCYGSKWDTVACLFSKNISPELMEQLRNYAFSRRPIEKIVVTSFNTVINKTKKPTQYEHVQACLNLIMTQSPEVVTQSLDDSKETIFNHTFAYFRAQQMFMGKYKQLDFLDMILLKLGTQEYKDSLFTDFLKRNNFVKYKQ